VGVEQIAGGRVFKGEAFISKPDILLFKDFEVGRSYKKNFILTNVSYTFNSFKLLALDDAVIDFFVITYEKPGRMSAGTYRMRLYDMSLYTLNKSKPPHDCTHSHTHTHAHTHTHTHTHTHRSHPISIPLYLSLHTPIYRHNNPNTNPNS
jgi:hypothetical protein